MDPVEISRRLKAGRWLAGGVDDDGKPKVLTTAELASRDPLPQNRITKNRIEEFEQLVTVPRQVELGVLADALGLPHSWFTAAKVAPIGPDVDAFLEVFQEFSERVAGLGATPEQPPHDTTDTPGQADTSAEAVPAHRQGTR